ncbi:MAG: secondary thiamine-phosphate synthase enzyme YjbQ [Methanobrevibacter sp.]|nr:secondary thiamine-phosphate synthase enzyme YjbQ [Candidatus Methanoflexus mossambicus]
MNVINKYFSIKTNKRFQIIDISQNIQDIVNKTEINDGIVNIFTKHSTSSIIINENEVGLLTDLKDLLLDIVPEKKYNHDLIDNNADSHLKAILLGTSETVSISSNTLNLGTWQSIFFVEFDGPRNRTINLTIMGC